MAVRTRQLPDDVLIRIRAVVPELTSSELRVAERALADPVGSSARTVTSLAEASGTSQATVVRFAKRLGFAGYPGLRLALAAAAAAERAGGADTVPGTEVAAGDDAATVIAKVGRVNAAAVRDTTAQLDPAALKAAADAIGAAHRIDVYGIGASAIVAQDLQMKLARIGRLGQVWADHHLALVSAAMLDRGDAAIAISHSGETPETVDALRQARSRRAVTIAITNHPGSTLAKAAHHVLTTSARETALRSGALASRIAALTVVDALFETIALRDVPATRRALQRTHDVVAGRRR